MDRNNLRKRVKKFRVQGKTYLEIQKILRTDIPKSTLSYWCKSIKLPSKYQERIKKLILNNVQKARAVALVANQIKREKYLKNLEKRNLPLLKNLNKNILKIALAMLYLGEGGKWKSHRALSLGSSNSNLIKLYLALLKRCYKIDGNRLRCRINYRADQDINKLQKFWSKITGIPLRHFYKTKPDPRTIGKITRKKDYMGVCMLHYGNTEIQLELEIIAGLLAKKISGPIV